MKWRVWIGAFAFLGLVDLTDAKEFYLAEVSIEVGYTQILGPLEFFSSNQVKVETVAEFEGEVRFATSSPDDCHILIAGKKYACTYTLQNYYSCRVAGEGTCSGLTETRLVNKRVYNRFWGEYQNKDVYEDFPLASAAISHYKIMIRVPVLREILSDQMKGDAISTCDYDRESIENAVARLVTNNAELMTNTETLNFPLAVTEDRRVLLDLAENEKASDYVITDKAEPEELSIKLKSNYGIFE